MRIALGLEYDGSKFVGWQYQPQQRTVQQSLNQAISFVANEAVETTAAGRTDSGVHALQQVVHFDTNAVRSERNWLLGLNTHLPSDINVVWAKPVTEEFHARFSAQSRRYRYLVLNRMSRSAVYHQRAWWVFQPIDIDRMQAAANQLIGHHDFSAFRAKECQAKSPMKTLDEISIIKRGDFIAIDVKAKSFLHHMVRNLVGVLVPVGQGKKPDNWPEQVLQSRERMQGGVTAPADGLYFVNVDYPQKYQLPTVSAFPVVW